jgi:hypothetical protein
MDALHSAETRLRPDYEDLYAELTKVATVRAFREALPNLVTPRLPRGDILAILLLAEDAGKRRQWQSSAQLFTYVIVLGLAFNWENEDVLVHHANRLILLARRHDAELKSKADLLLYAYKRLAASLRADGVRAAQQPDWIATSVAECASFSNVRMDGARSALAQFESPILSENSKYRGHAIHANATLHSALDLLAQGKTTYRAKGRSPFKNIAILAVTSLAAACIAVLLRDRLYYPQASVLFQGPNLLGAALVWWPMLLATTWVFALLESKRTHTLHYIGPQHFRGTHALVAGEVMPFARDWFFHIFQFVWVPFLLIACLLFAKSEALPGFLQTSSRMGAEANASSFVASLPATFFPTLTLTGGAASNLRSLVNSDIVALIFAGISSVLFMGNQIRIQRDRAKTSINMYWWDIRISKPEWIVRLAMVGLDTFLGAIILFKILAIALVAYELVTSTPLAIVYFSPDGVGGLKPLTDVFKNLSWLVFVFGLFVMAGTYLHWSLPEYRKTDAAVFAIYLALVGLLMLPLFILEGQFQVARDTLMATLPVPNTQALSIGPSEVARQLRDVNEIRNWNISAINAGVLDGPLLPLVLQLLAVVGQYVVRASGLQRLLPGGHEIGATNKESLDD